MPFCPSCRYEYEAGISICPDCGATLVEQLPETVDHPDYEQWIPLVSLTSQQLADMVLEGLRAKDIPAVIHSEVGYFGAVGAMGTANYAPVGGAYIILVPREFVPDADIEGEIILGEDWKKAKIVTEDSK